MTTMPSGTLANNMGISHLVLDLHANKKTGIAFFEHETSSKKIYFKDGDIIFADSNNEEDSLGECLLLAQKITRAHYDVSREIIQKTKKHQGAVLIELGFIQQPDLIEGVRLQIQHVFFSLFSWPTGKYRFEGGPPPTADIQTVTMNTVTLIVDAIRQLDWKAIRKSLPPLKTILTPPDGSGALHPDNLSADHKAVLALIDGKRSMEEVCSLSGLGDFNTLGALHFLLSLRMVRPGAAKPAEVRAPAQKPSPKTAQPAAAKPAAETESPEQMIEKAFNELQGQNHYQVLQVTEQATAQEIKKSYFRLAKLYHPDRYQDHDVHNMKPMLEKLFASITEAYNVLSIQAKRNEYDLSRAAKSKKIKVAEDKSDRSGAALAQFNKGMKDFKEKNFWGALDAFIWAARLDGTNAKYVFHQALALSKMPLRIHEAEDTFKKAIEMEPTNATYYVELGNFYLKMRLKARALAEFKKALEWDPDSEQAKQGIQAAGEEKLD